MALAEFIAAGENEAIGTADSAAPDDELQRRISKGGTIRHNVSVAQLLSDEESQQLQEWVARTEGPWRQDLARYPGPNNDAIGEAGQRAGPEAYAFCHNGFQCELFRNDYLAW